MAKQLFGNNASSLLAASISDSDLSIQVQGGFGAFFPNPGADEYFLVTLENSEGDIEVVKVDERVSDLLNIPVAGRGQEGTSAQAWTNGQARVELRLTKGTMELFIQRGGDAMEGDLDMDGNEVKDAQLTGTGTKILAGEIVNVPLRGATGDSSNEVRTPTDGTRATAGGQRILTEDDDLTSQVFAVGMGVLWFGTAVAVPDGWAICDGSGGTPDMRDRFIVGAGSTYAKGDAGGAASVTPTTGTAGAHTHGGVTGATVLTADSMPAHHHRLYSWIGNGSDGEHDSVSRPGGAGIGGQRKSQSSGGSFGYAEFGNTTGNTDQLVEDTGGVGAGHTHTIASDGVHSHSVSAVPILPLFRAWYIILRVA